MSCVMYLSLVQISWIYLGISTGTRDVGIETSSVLFTVLFTGELGVLAPVTVNES